MKRSQAVRSDTEGKSVTQGDRAEWPQSNAAGSALVVGDRLFSLFDRGAVGAYSGVSNGDVDETALIDLNPLTIPHFNALRGSRHDAFDRVVVLTRNRIVQSLCERWVLDPLSKVGKVCRIGVEPNDARERQRVILPAQAGLGLLLVGAKVRVHGRAEVPQVVPEALSQIVESWNGEIVCKGVSDLADEGSCSRDFRR